MYADFFFNIKGEFLKLKRTSALWLTFFAAAFLPAINFIICIERPKELIPKLSITPWVTFFHMNWKNTAAVILPVYAILLINQVLQIEFRNSTWKQIYSSPRKYADIFFSKFIVIQATIICYILMLNCFIILSGYAVNLVEKGYSFYATKIPWFTITDLSVRIYIGILSVTAIQYWLSMRFRNFAVSLGVGLGLWCTGLVLMGWENIKYYPYIYSTLLFFIDTENEPIENMRLIYYSLISFPIFLVLGFLSIYKLKEKG